MADTTMTRYAEIARTKKALNTTSPARVLSAMGHPGYGRKFSEAVLTAWAKTPGACLHSIVYSPGLQKTVV